MSNDSADRHPIIFYGEAVVAGIAIVAMASSIVCCTWNARSPTASSASAAQSSPTQSVTLSDGSIVVPAKEVVPFMGVDIPTGRNVSVKFRPPLYEGQDPFMSGVESVEPIVP